VARPAEPDVRQVAGQTIERISEHAARHGTALPPSMSSCTAGSRCSAEWLADLVAVLRANWSCHSSGVGYADWLISVFER